MAAVSEHEVAALVGLGICTRLAGLLACHRDRLQIIGHCVAIGRIVVPGLHTHALAHFLLDELARKGDTRVKAAIVADLQDQARILQALSKLLALLHVDAQRFLDQQVLSSRDRLESQRHMIGIRGGENDRLHLRVGQHLIVVAVGDAWPMNRGHARQQIAGHIANSVQLRIAGLSASVEVCELRDWTAA